jgi:PPK2 family polyphosphate:nucleotide phosphotransferase
VTIEREAYRVPSADAVRLRDWPTTSEPTYASNAEYRAMLAADVEALSELQRRLYASDRYALLLLFQAMDTAGKDGAISHVLTGVNPEGCDVHSFKEPTAAELAHDFLWRTTCRLPARGRIGVFNRSYYEELLVVRVHPSVLASERIPGAATGSAALWRGRYTSIVELERHLHRNGTRIVKIFLHLSRNEQRKRLLARIDEPDKRWKFSDADVVERRYWHRYRRAYEACLSHTSIDEAPWYVVPADNKENARLIVSRIVIDAVRDLDPEYPDVTGEERRVLRRAGKRLRK